MTNYFAYGANMNPQHLAERCPTARPLGRGTLPDHRFGIAALGYGDAVPAQGSTIHGVLWELEPADEAALDAFEGIAEGHYRKSYALARHCDGAPLQVMLYRASDSTPGRPVVPYLQSILASAAVLGLPAGYVEELRALLPPDAGHHRGSGELTW